LGNNLGESSPEGTVLMEYYVLRIYRRSESPAAEPVGVVELVESRQRIRFQGFSELIGILRVRRSSRSGGKRRVVTGSKSRRG
jgi:hypothetical protein